MHGPALLLHEIIWYTRSLQERANDMDGTDRWESCLR